MLNLNANVRAILLGLLQIIPELTIFRILEFTKKSASPQLAYKRYRATSLHGQIWVSRELKPGSKAWASIKHVRQIHLFVSKRAETKGLGIVSQKDMAITQFAFVGMQLLRPEMIGIKGSRQQFEDFSHFWRVLGHLLGIEDRFNVCGVTLNETLSRLEAIREDLLLPNLTNMDTRTEEYLRIAVEGMKGFEPWLEVDAQLFTIKRFFNVPGYGYYTTELSNNNAYDKLTLYTRLRISLDVLIYEYLSKVWAFRWCFNISRMCFSIFDHFPIFAILKFGRKVAYVKVLDKSKET